ncbi:integrase domain-containing protein [Klebsiella oxytoca]|uniref:integrase domain-containing protein n=1 Tax=Klebsiella oxytoca TaxID=571 RepID=UPI00190ED1F4|nr:integrase domain-containing protein [Klebsiella oxytoca]
MSRREKLLKRSLVNLIKKSGGSFKKISDYSLIMERLASRLAAMNVQINSAEQLKVRHIEMYIASRRNDDRISKRTGQNEMSAIRCMLNKADKTLMADPSHERLSNKALGLSGASRKGTKSSISDERYREILAGVEKKDRGVAAAARLSRYLGLRNEEAVQAVKSLQTWKKSLDNGDNKLKVIFGTKGGRVRMTTVVHPEKVKEAVEAALAYSAEHNGKLIDKSGLKSALDYYINVLRRDGGLKGGRETPHSLRYSYAADAMQYHLCHGFSHEESLALTSIDLGHGDGRGTYIKNVYYQSDDDSE